MMKTIPNTTPAASERIPAERAAFLDLLRRRPVAGVDRVSAPSSVRRRAYARAIAEIRSYVAKPLPGEGAGEVFSYEDLRNEVDAGARR